MTLVKHELKQGKPALLIWTAVIAFMLAVCILKRTDRRVSPHPPCQPEADPHPEAYFHAAADCHIESYYHCRRNTLYLCNRRKAGCPLPLPSVSSLLSSSG